MTASAEQIAQLRRMVSEVAADVYDDPALAAIIETETGLDPRGEMPGTWDTSTTPPTWVANDAWIPTYDLHAAAAAIWEEKAALLAQDYDFRADGGEFTRSQAYEHAMRQARYHRSRRRPGTISLVMSPKPEGTTP